MKLLPALRIRWVGWAVAFTGEFVLFYRHREDSEYCWTLWLGPLRIRRRAREEGKE